MWSFLTSIRGPGLAALLTGCLLAAGPRARAADAAVSKEYQVKAAFLYNFTRFVEWPAGRFADDTSSIVVGVLGPNPFGMELENIVRDRKVNGRRLSIVRLEKAGDARAVHAVFVVAGEERLVEGELGALLDAGVLVVGDSERFLALGGTVTFTTVDDRVRFEINTAVAARGGLKISAQLQKLATAVQRPVRRIP